MRAADAAAIRSGIPSGRLMENAAEGLAEELVRSYPRARVVTVVCGPGNNGGDGLAAARLLAAGGRSVSVFTLADPGAYRGDAAANAALARKAGLDLVPLSGRGAGAFSRNLRNADVVVDALFGTGLARALSGVAARAVSRSFSARRSPGRCSRTRSARTGTTGGGTRRSKATVRPNISGAGRTISW